MQGNLFGAEIKFEFGCPCCGEAMKVTLDTAALKHKVEHKPDSTFAQKMEIIQSYEKLKGFDNLPDWRVGNLKRAMAETRRLLTKFRSCPDPKSLALEFMRERAEECARKGWHWDLAKLGLWADEWLIRKMEGRNTNV